MLTTNIFQVFICKLSYKYKTYLVILLETNKNLGIHFYYTILTFNLLVGLWIKSNKILVLNFKNFAKQISKFQEKK